MVAPLSMRAGTRFAELAPGPAAKVAAKLGGDRVAQELRDGQIAKR